jgi:hypothetical protein
MAASATTEGFAQVLRRIACRRPETGHRLDGAGRGRPAAVAGDVAFPPGAPARRHRRRAALGSAEILPALSWLEPSSALHILRIVQESLRQHSANTRSASEIRVSTAPEARWRARCHRLPTTARASMWRQGAHRAVAGIAEPAATRAGHRRGRELALGADGHAVHVVAAPAAQAAEELEGGAVAQSAPACPWCCGRSSLMANQGAFERTKMCALGEWTDRRPACPG